MAAGLSALSLADRATIANMAPEYGATMGFFPVDDGTLELSALHQPRRRNWSRWSKLMRRNRACSGPRHAGPAILGHARTGSGDRGAVAWPVRSARRTASNLPEVKKNFKDAFGDGAAEERSGRDGRRVRQIESGAVVIAAITSCTNTSNPSVMIARRPAREEGGGARAEVEAVGEDQPGAGIESRDRLLDEAGPDAVSRST